MSGKSRAKKPLDTAAEDALLQLQALYTTHREATRLLLMAVMEGATDAQIAIALRQGLPHLADPASLQDRRAGKEPEGTGTTENGKQPAAQKQRTRTTSQAPTTQPGLLAADFAAALGALPPDDWCRTWAAGRTIMLRRTSKKVKGVVDKMRLPAVVRLSRSFWDDANRQFVFNFDNFSFSFSPGEKEKLQFVLRQLTALTARSASPHSNCADAQLQNHTQSGLQEECWRSAQRWCTLMSVEMRSGQMGQRALQQFWGSAHRLLTWISAAMISDQTGQRALQECWRSAQRWRTSISAALPSTSGTPPKGKIRSVRLGQRVLQEC